MKINADEVMPWDDPSLIAFCDDDEAIVEWERKQEEQKIKDRKRAARIPSRYLAAALDSCPALAAAEAKKLLAGEGSSLYLFSEDPELCSRTAAAIANAAAESFGVLFVGVDELASKSRSTYSGGENEEQIVRRLAGTGVLILDDVDPGAMTSATVKILLIVLKRRNRERKATVMTSQYNADELKKQLAYISGENVATSLFKAFGGVAINLDGEQKAKQ